MKPLIAFACLACLALPLTAEMCTLDVVPAATLLVPYFEVDLGSSNGLNTVFSINNAAPEPALVHLIFWTDWGVPTLDFDVFLTGYDVVTVDLRSVFVSGNIPITADEQSDPDDTTSPHGDPSWDGSFFFCDQFFPFFINPVISPSFRNLLQAAHTGQQTFLGECLGADHGDDVMRGYVTVDVTNRCSLILNVGDSGYFEDGGAGVASNRNVLWGDVIYLDPGNGTANVQPLVHVEADPSFNAASTPSGTTFYGAHLGGSGRDNREPLGTTWATRFVEATATDRTRFLVWRDTADVSLVSAVDLPCGPDPPWFPLDERQVVCFDDQENGVEPCQGSSCFPLATQLAEPPALPFTTGWCRLDLNHDCPTCDPDGFDPGGIAQSYVAAVHHPSALYAGGLPAIRIAAACAGFDATVKLPPLFTDGFELGDTSAWSFTFP